MTDAEPTLLLTRPEAQSRAFLHQCEAAVGRRLPTVVSPVMEIERIGELPDLDGYGTSVFTSGNGVRSALETGSLTGRTVATVGKKTADLAKAAGADAVPLGEDVDGFIAGAGDLTGPVLLCRGVHSRGDLAERLRGLGLAVDEAVIYDQAARALSSAALSLLAGTNPVIVPIFSPRSAALLAGYGEITAPVTVIAMSRNVADAWSGPGEVLVAEKPTSEAMCSLTISYF